MHTSQPTHEKGVEIVIAGLTAILWVYQTTTAVSLVNKAAKTAGSIKKGPTFLSSLIVPAHFLATVLPPVAYLSSVAADAFIQPTWWTRYALPANGLSLRDKTLFRTIALVAFYAAGRIGIMSMRHLGSQLAAIGIRDKPELVTSGPYAYVRHPLYLGVLLQSLFSSVVYWSYIPLVGLGVELVAFYVKLPIEEGLIESDERIGAQYKEYKKRVPHRVLPYIW